MTIFPVLALILFGSFGMVVESAQPEKDSECPLACPEGWVRFAYSENCYKLPAQPAHQDTFWNHQRRCQEMEPTSYIAVMDSVVEQAFATPVAIEHASNWFPVLSANWLSGFMWLGGYTDQHGWKFLDGTDQTGSVMMIATNITGSQKNNTCLGADPKTLGLWQTRPCMDTAGAAICEMPRRRVCGKTGGFLPISPVDITVGGLSNLFPKLPSIPNIVQILGKSALDNDLNGINDAVRLNNAPWIFKLPPGCRLDCPAGWFTWNRGPTSRCYLIPSVDRPDTFWNMNAKCQKNDRTAHVLMINEVLKESTTSAVIRSFGPKWQHQQRRDDFLWLGAYTDNSGWHTLDNTDINGNLLMAMANLTTRTPGSFKNGTCLGSDLTNAGAWFTAPCDRKSGFAICSMPKKPICGHVAPVGTLFDFPAIELTPEQLQQLFPHSPTVPFLADLLDGRSQSTSDKTGDAVANVFCANAWTGFPISVNGKPVKTVPVNAIPDWTWLKVKGQQATVAGQWDQVKCKTGTVDVFKVKPISYLSAWVHCYNMGYEVAMPANTRFTFPGPRPFQVNDLLTDYYRQDHGPNGKLLTPGFVKIPMSDIENC